MIETYLIYFALAVKVKWNHFHTVPEGEEVKIIAVLLLGAVNA